tara:strand:- start:49 stop:414 length:366 start_codon:yes stop_codon:yes gene_type:complete
MITINFTGNINNDSLQIGDLAYFITPSLFGGYNTSIDPVTGEYVAPILIGNIVQIGGDFIEVNDTSAQGVVGPNDFIMFAKDSKINLSGLIGYYAEVKIKNNSTEKAEMFSIASEVTPSSK